MSAAEAWARLPGPVRQVALAGLGVIAVAAVAFRRTLAAHPFLLVVLGAALAVVVGAVVAFALAARARDRAQSAPFARGLTGLLRGTPGGLTPEEIAELDRLDRSFQEGIEVFRRAGKNVYELPWYIFVGEPGSGKTEAIRRAGIPSPPGLNDPLQGVGGTINMNWWFNNHAVIIDTAGKMMFKSAPPGKTTEWRRFLEWLRKARRKRPITGMFLVIPADTLITDSPEQIEAKATTIAERFDGIQRTLGVRFPVYVLVTKCDKIPGFRDFFADLTGPGIQEQLVGWSNPDLDRFDPQAVVKHLQSVQRRMRARRRMLLLDPVPPEGPSVRRLDQVDSLYEFPEALLGLSPRLTRYLETIFTQGAWTAMPPFLRGIYFTSSRQEGEECDKAVADLLGVGVDQLRGGSHWAQERGMFLRDLFLTKAFKELGLVSRARNVRAARRSALTGLLGLACVAVGGLFALGWHWKSSLDRDLERFAAAFGRAAAMTRARDPGPGAPDSDPIDLVGEGDGDFLVYLDADTTPPRERFTLLSELRDLSSPGAAPGVPALFRLFGAGSGYRDRLRPAAAQAFELASLARVVELLGAGDSTSVAERLLADPARLLARDAEELPTPAERRGALAALAQGAVNAAPAGVEPRPMDLAPLLAVALADSDEEGQAAWREHAADFERLRDELGALGRVPEDHHQVVGDAFEALRGVLESGAGSAGQAIARFTTLRDAAERFKALDAELIALARKVAADPVGATHEDLLGRWDESLGALRQASEAMSSAALPAGASARDECERALAQEAAAVLAGLEPVFAADRRPPQGADEPEESPGWAAWFDDLRAAAEAFQRRTSEAAAEVTAALGALDGDVLAPAGEGRRVHEVRLAIHAAALTLARADDPGPSAYEPGAIARGVAAMDGGSSAGQPLPAPVLALRDLLSAEQRLAPAPWVGEQESAAAAVVASAERRRFRAWLARVCADAPARVEGLAAGAPGTLGAGEPIPFPALPLTPKPAAATEIAEFHPKAAEGVFADLRALRAMASDSPLAAELRAPEPGGLGQAARAAEAAMDAFRAAYVEFWSDAVPARALTVRDFADWAEFHAALAGEQVTPVQGHSERIDEFLARVVGALRLADPQSARAAALDRLRRAYTDRFDASCTSALEEWMALPADAARAREAVLSLTPAEFRARYLTPLLLERQAGAGESPRGYWGEVLVAGLRALARSAGPGGEPAAFPLARLAGQDLTPEQLRRAAEAWRGPAPFAEGSLGRLGGAAVQDPALAPLIDQLRGPVPGSEHALAALAAALTAPEPLRVTVRPLPPGEAPQAADAFAGVPSQPEQVEVSVGERRESFPIREPAPVEAAVSGQGASPVEFRLLRDEASGGGPVAEPARFAGPWGLLAALRHPDAVSRSPTVWDAPLDFTIGGKACRYWLRLEFSAPLPTSAQWPR